MIKNAAFLGILEPGDEPVEPWAKASKSKPLSQAGRDMGDTGHLDLLRPEIRTRLAEWKAEKKRAIDGLRGPRG